MPIDNTPIIDLNTGDLYLTPLDGGDPVRLGRATEIKQTAEYNDKCELGEPAHLMSRPASLSFECTLQDVTFDPVIFWRLTHNVRYVILWAKENRPKLLRLAAHAKTNRKRRKNARRILRDFFEEVNHVKD